jgi:AraC-like DNA-binding protein
VKETAARLGFSTEFQFSRCFKRMEGRSPTAHVRAMTEKGGTSPVVSNQEK